MKNLRSLAEGKGSTSLTIAPVSYDDGGVYECVADNGIQPVIKSNFTLTIRGREKNSHMLLKIKSHFFNIMSTLV